MISCSSCSSEVGQFTIGSTTVCLGYVMVLQHTGMYDICAVHAVRLCLITVFDRPKAWADQGV